MNSPFNMNAAAPPDSATKTRCFVQRLNRKVAQITAKMRDGNPKKIKAHRERNRNNPIAQQPIILLEGFQKPLSSTTSKLLRNGAGMTGHSAKQPMTFVVGYCIYPNN
jgi:hypothetical protein